MSHLTNSRVFNQARQNIRSIAKLCNSIRGFGDISNQAKRAAISVASNIAAPQGYKKGARKRNSPTKQKFLPHSPRIQPRTPRSNPHYQRSTPTQRPHRKHYIRRKNAYTAHSKYGVMHAAGGNLVFGDFMEACTKKPVASIIMCIAPGGDGKDALYFL